MISLWSVRVPFSPKSSIVYTLLLLILGTSPSAIAQTSASPLPVSFSTDQDRQNIMDQLGIKALRPGYSGNATAPNHATYDESKADPFPNIHESLVLNNGQKVITGEVWWKRRRPELVDNSSKYVSCGIPQNVP